MGSSYRVYDMDVGDSAEWKEPGMQWLGGGGDKVGLNLANGRSLTILL